MMKILMVLVISLALMGCQPVADSQAPDTEKLGETIALPPEPEGQEPGDEMIAEEGEQEAMNKEPLPPVQAPPEEEKLPITLVTNPDGETDLIFLREIFQAFIAYYVDEGLATMELVYVPDSGNGELATSGLLCARQQDMELEYLKRVVAGKDITLKMYLTAEDILDYDAFTECLTSDATRNMLEAGIQQAQSLGVTETPTTFIGDEKVVGFKAFKEFQAIIDSKLQ